MADKIVTLKDKNDNNLYPVAGALHADTVITGSIKDNAVTTPKIANNAVTSDKIDWVTSGLTRRDSPDLYITTAYPEYQTIDSIAIQKGCMVLGRASLKNLSQNKVTAEILMNYVAGGESALDYCDIDIAPGTTSQVTIWGTTNNPVPQQCLLKVRATESNVVKCQFYGLLRIGTIN